MPEGRTVTVWKGIAKGDEVGVRGERRRFVFLSALMDGETCRYVTVKYHPTAKRSGVRMFTPERIQDLGMVL